MVKRLALAMVCSVGVAHADDPPQADETPPLSPARITGEVLVGGLFEVGGGFVGAYIGGHLDSRDDCLLDSCNEEGIALGALVGAAVVTPVGVYLIGNTGGETGSFAATFGGSAVGALVGFGGFALTDRHPVAGVLLIAGPVVGALIGFNTTRRYEHRARTQRTWAPVASSVHGTTSFGLVGSF
jgi:hypothetical protein